jgi:hypothetical protein
MAETSSANRSTTRPVLMGLGTSRKEGRSCTEFDQGALPKLGPGTQFSRDRLTFGKRDLLFLDRLL